LDVGGLDTWLGALEERHLADLTPTEVARALRALSSCYVERRGRLAQGGALESAGKRAAFALFYGPLHFFVTRAIVRAMEGAASVAAERTSNASEPRERSGDPGGPASDRVGESEGAKPPRLMDVLDLGCGTGTAGAAWALERGRCTIHGVDRHPWAAAEANWTYRTLGLAGHAAQGTIDRTPISGRRDQGILAAYAVNELSDASRTTLLARLLDAHARGSRILIVEPIAKRVTSWWPEWEKAFGEAGGRSDEWRFPAELPERQRQLARAAGLQPRELTARSLWLA
jgi:hypothetical protein